MRENGVGPATRGLLAVAMFAMFALVAACGGDGGGSGVDSDKPLEAVTEEDLEQICEWYEDEVRDIDIVRWACYITALDLADDDPALCEELFDVCIEDASNEDLEEFDLDCTIDSELGEVDDCASDFTVGDMEDCLGAYVSQAQDTAGSASCENSIDELLDALDLTLVPECAALFEACPDL